MGVGRRALNNLFPPRDGVEERGHDLADAWLERRDHRGVNGAAIAPAVQGR